jgi:hypothetical protein
MVLVGKQYDSNVVVTIMDMQGLFKKFSVFFCRGSVEKKDSLSQFDNIKADLEKQGVTITSEEALVSFLSDESSDVAELLNKNRLGNARSSIVEMVEPLNSQSARMQPILTERE